MIVGAQDRRRPSRRRSDRKTDQGSESRRPRRSTYRQHGAAEALHRDRAQLPSFVEAAIMDEKERYDRGMARRRKILGNAWVDLANAKKIRSTRNSRILLPAPPGVKSGHARTTTNVRGVFSSLVPCSRSTNGKSSACMCGRHLPRAGLRQTTSRKSFYNAIIAETRQIMHSSRRRNSGSLARPNSHHAPVTGCQPELKCL